MRVNIRFFFIYAILYCKNKKQCQCIYNIEYTMRTTILFSILFMRMCLWLVSVSQYAREREIFMSVYMHSCPCVYFDGSFCLTISGSQSMKKNRLFVSSLSRYSIFISLFLWLVSHSVEHKCDASK